MMMKQVVAISSALVMLGGTLAPAFAYDRYDRYHGYNRSSRYSDYNRYDRRNGQSQYVKKAVIGGAAGAALGGLMGSEGYRTESAIKGGLLGAGAGLGYEYLRRNVLSNNSRW
jgi:outer membrane lipoprotein SlyB